MATLTTEKLSDTVGVEILDVDVERLLTDDELPAACLDLLEQHSVLLTDVGGETGFASTYAAYDDLSAAEKEQFDELRVIHSMAKVQRLAYPNPTPEQEADWARWSDREHPLVWKHDSGRKSLVFGASAARIVGPLEATPHASYDPRRSGAGQMTTRTAIVTGGASGIGGAIARRFAADGARVAIFDVNGDAAEAAATAIEETGGTAIGLAVDVTDRAVIDAAIGEVRSRLGTPTILVNSAGITLTGPTLEFSAEDWNTVLAINLTGTFDCCQAVLPGMIAQGWGRIVNISSSSMHSGVPRMAAYVSSKAAVVGLTKVLALEFARNGVTVNTIPPGFIETPMLDGAKAEGVFDLEKQLANTPVGRIGQPEDIAAACAYLVSEEASYVTGQVIGVNGGRNT